MAHMSQWLMSSVDKSPLLLCYMRILYCDSETILIDWDPDPPPWIAQEDLALILMRQLEVCNRNDRQKRTSHIKCLTHLNLWDTV